MSSQLVGDIKEALERYEREAPLRALQENLSDVEHLIAGRPDQCISFWPSNMNMELLEKLRQRFIAKIDAFKRSESGEMTPEQEHIYWAERSLKSMDEVISVYASERSAELRGDATVDPGDIGNIIRAEMKQLRGQRETLYAKYQSYQLGAQRAQDHSQSVER